MKSMRWFFILMAAFTLVIIGAAMASAASEID
jgi:hypothetical protein